MTFNAHQVCIASMLSWDGMPMLLAPPITFSTLIQPMASDVVCAYSNTRSWMISRVLVRFTSLGSPELPDDSVSAPSSKGSSPELSDDSVSAPAPCR